MKISSNSSPKTWLLGPCSESIHSLSDVKRKLAVAGNNFTSGQDFYIKEQYHLG